MKKNTKKRILMLLENCPFPQDTRVRNEANSLVKAGYSVSIICPGTNGQKSRENVDGVWVYRYPSPPEADGFIGYITEYGYSFIMALILSVVIFFRRGFDVIHAHNPPDIYVVIGIFYKLLGKKFVFDHHDLSPDMYFAVFPEKSNKYVHKILLFFERLSCRVADHVIVTNESYKEIDSTRGGKDEATITVVRNGPIIENNSSENIIDDNQNSPVIKLCYVGDMGFHDGLDYLIRALNILVNKYNTLNYHCTLVGDGDAFESVKELARDLKLDRQLTFIGRVSHKDVASYIQSADICLAPEPSNSYNDRSTVIKIMEYMTFAKPIVAFNLAENHYSAQEAALYAEPNDESDFANKILILMNDPDKRQELGQAGKLRIVEELAWKHQEKALLNVYENL